MGNGECLNPGGGSFSYDCRGLNSGPDAPYSPTVSHAVGDFLSLDSDFLMENKYLIGGAVVVVGALVFMKMNSKKK